MGKLNQVLAVLKGKNAKCDKEITEAYHILQKEVVFQGQTRVYTPKDDEGDKLPSENQIVRMDTKEVIKKAFDAWTELFDVVATQEGANCKAVADIVVEGHGTLLFSVPVTTLLFQEKRLQDVLTFATKLPVLPDGVVWKFNAGKGIYESEPVETVRTKKVPRVQVLYEATDKHPAQVQAFSEDILVGTWKTTLQSSAMSQSDVVLFKKKITALLEGVKKAREEANSIECDERHIGETIFSYILD